MVVVSPAPDLPPGGARALARCEALRLPPFSDSAEGLFRAYLSPAHRATLDRVGQWMAEAGMSTRLDPAANLIGRYEGSGPGAPALLIGSHLDSVRDAGAYDGPLGIMLGIEVVAGLHAAGRRLPFAIEVYGFGDEEGSRFPAAMLTSRAVAGTLTAEALAVTDAEGTRLSDLIDTAAYLGAARAPGEVLAYLEAHIEQGPVLEAEGLALGTVTGIAAQLRHRITVTGTAGHAGTTAMRLRRDALAGAAEMVLAVEGIAWEARSDLVATVGWIEALPGAANVIPGEVRFTLDVRAGEGERRNHAAREILAAIERIAATRQLGLTVETVHDLPASPCDATLMDLMDRAVAKTGQAPFRLVSGAGHDAMALASLAPTAMLFIRCRGGISHNPAEHVEPADADRALAAMLHFIDMLGEARAQP